MRRPVNSPYTITTKFGVPDSNAKFGYHSGIDYAVPLYRPIYAPAGGKLTNVVSPTGGNMVVIFDGKYYHRLMHNSSFSRSSGVTVAQGAEVAKAGTTGLSTGVHCHHDINTQGVYPTSFSAFVDPEKLLTQGGTVMPTKQDVIDYFTVWEKRQPDAGEIANYTSKTWRYLTDNLLKAQKRRYEAKLAAEATPLVSGKKYIAP